MRLVSISRVAEKCPGGVVEDRDVVGGEMGIDSRYPVDGWVGIM